MQRGGGEYDKDQFSTHSKMLFFRASMHFCEQEVIKSHKCYFITCVHISSLKMLNINIK